MNLTTDIQGTWLLPRDHAEGWRLLGRSQPRGWDAAYDRRAHQLLSYSGNPTSMPAPGIGAPARGGASVTEVLAGGTWTRLPATAEDANGVLATDPRTGRVVLLTELGHTFTWTGTQWQRVRIPGPPAGSLPTLITDPADRLILAVYTPHDGAGDTTWTYDGHWTRPTGNTP